MKARIAALACAGTLVVVVPAGRAVARGSAINVTTTADDLKTNGNCTLREALKAVDTKAKVDKCAAPIGTATINVPAGTYTLSLGELTTKSRVNIVGAGASTVIKGKGQGSTASRDLHVLNGAVVMVSKLTLSNAWSAIRNEGVLTLTNVTISGNGYDAMSFDDNYRASGLDNRGQATLVGTTFSNNGGPQFAEAGEAMVTNAAGKTVTITSSTFKSGHLDGTVIDNFGQLNVSGSTFNAASDDEFPDSDGEDIYNEASGNAQINSTVFEHESADGGTYAIQNLGIANADSIVIDHNMGALYNGGTLHVTNSTVSNNVYGDAVDNYGNLQVATTTFTGNDPGFNAIIQNGHGSAVLVNVTMTGNEMGEDGASGLAGAIDNYATITARNVTITGNKFDGGPGSPGGITNEPGHTFKIANSIVAGNSNPDDANGRDCHGTFTSLGWNLVQSTAGGCSFAGTTTGNVYGKAPKLGALANNGGPTETLLPQSGSPAIDAGNPATPGMSPPQLCPLFDQRNVARPCDGNHDGVKRCDIGAVEV